MPTVAVHSHVFARLAKSVARANGMPTARQIFVPQPVVGRTPAQLRAYIDGDDPVNGGAFADGLLERKLPVAGGAPGPHLSHIVSIGAMGEGQDHTENPELQSLSDFLTEAKVVHTIRRGMLRFAFHIYNSDQDVAHVLELIDRWRARPNA